MIENMRKYTGLMVVVLVLLAAGLILTMGPQNSNRGGGSDFMNVNGVSLDRNDFSKEGQNTIRAIQHLSQMQNYGDYFKLLELPRSLMGNAESETQGHINFVTNRILLKQAAEELGIYASSDIAAKYIEENMFKSRDGNFDSKSYQAYIKSLGSLGLKENDFQQLIAEYIVFTKAREVIGGGITSSKKETLALMKSQQQTIQLSTVSFKFADFQKAITPTDEEVKTYWETHKDAYPTDRQLKVTYALTLLDKSDEPKRPTPAADADPSDTAKLNLEYADKHAAWTEKRKVETKRLTKIFNDFCNEFMDAGYTDLQKHADKAIALADGNISVITTEPFTPETAPAELKALTVKHANTNLVDTLFQVEVQNDVKTDTQPYGVGEDGHILVRIDEEIKPSTKSFEQAKELAKADLIKKLATEAMTAAAEAAKTEISELVTSGKSFSDAAKEKELTAVVHAPLSAALLKDNQDKADFFRIAQTTDPKTIASDLSITDDAASIVFVDSRIFEITADNLLKETNTISQVDRQHKMATFNAWLTTLKEKADSEGALNLPIAN